jgi:hypothetical protein
VAVKDGSEQASDVVTYHLLWPDRAYRADLDPNGQTSSYTGKSPSTVRL